MNRILMKEIRYGSSIPSVEGAGVQNYNEIGKGHTICIVKCLNDVVFRIRKGRNGKDKVVHGNRLWPYNGRDSTFNGGVES